MSELDGKTWFELREPGCVPERKGPMPPEMVADFLRELFAARPEAYITVITMGHDGPSLQDGPECLQMLDGRSMSVGRRHIKSSAEAHADRRPSPPPSGDVEARLRAMNPWVDMDWPERVKADADLLASQAQTITQERELRKAAEGERDEALERVEELEGYGEEVANEFEKDCWKALRSLLSECGFDWSGGEAVTADNARETIREELKYRYDCFKRAEARYLVAEAQLTQLRKDAVKVDRILRLDLNVNDEELLRIRNECEGKEGQIKIWSRMLQKIIRP